MTAGREEDLLDGSIEFVADVVPELEDGDYEVIVGQRVHSTAGDPFDEVYVNRTRFRVEGPRYRLEPDAVHTVFPPPESLGEYAGVLPHVVLARPTLPWERSADATPPPGKGTAGERVPWLAVLLFHDSDPVASPPPTGPPPGGPPWQPRTVTVADLGRAVAGQRASELGDPCQVVDVPWDLWLEVAPRHDELRWLAHGRTVVKAPTHSTSVAPAGDVSVVIGNRLPHPNQRNTAHLVSLEGMEALLPGASLPSVVPTSVRLVSLKSWSFTSRDPEETFTGLLSAPSLTVGAFAVEDGFTVDVGRRGPKVQALALAGDHAAICWVGGGTLRFGPKPGVQWEFLRLTDGTYNIVRAGAAEGELRYLSTTREGDKVDLWAVDDASGRQRWRVTSNPDRTVRIAISGGVSTDRSLLSVESGGRLALVPVAQDPRLQHWAVDRPPPSPPPILAHLDAGYLAAARNVGYAALDHSEGDGAQTTSWYRGPLLPYGKPLTGRDGPVDRAEELTVVDERSGLLDTSYAAAWQLGQLLGLASPTFSKALTAWKHANAVATALALEQRTLHEHLGDLLGPVPAAGGHVATLDAAAARTMGQWPAADVATGGDADPATFGSFTRPVGTDAGSGVHAAFADHAADPATWSDLDAGTAPPPVVSDWLDQLRLLVGVPFAYLVPDEALLPHGSLRFFRVDPNWTTALVEGAFSIGRTSAALATHDAARHAQVHATDEGKIVSGVLLRSAVVAGWPALRATVKDRDGQVLPIRRFVHLAPSVLLVLVSGAAPIASVRFSEPPEGLHFGVNANDPSHLDKVLRRLGPGKRTDGRFEPVGSELSGILDPLEVPYRSAELGVLDIRALRQAMSGHLETLWGGPAPRGHTLPFTSAEFALQMVEGVQSVEFEVARP